MVAAGVQRWGTEREEGSGLVGEQNEKKVPVAERDEVVRRASPNRRRGRRGAKRDEVEAARRWWSRGGGN